MTAKGSGWQMRRKVPAVRSVPRWWIGVTTAVLVVAAGQADDILAGMDCPPAPPPVELGQNRPVQVRLCEMVTRMHAQARMFLSLTMAV
jgi:hypothetical protein